MAGKRKAAKRVGQEREDLSKPSKWRLQHGGFEGPVREAAAILARRLEELGKENRRLLERAVALQSRVIETIAGAALPKASVQGYAPAGYRQGAGRAPALALSARA